jgi:DNA-binding transcriptional ArsR family regulator
MSASAVPAPSRLGHPDDGATSVHEVDVAAVAALIGEPTRCAMLHAVLDGTARPAGELARVAGIAAPTASAHLSRLVQAGPGC